ncbi:hypothetical protein [Deinococcus aquaticus]|uniref:Uncharacterized protein n=1 Tax=Deinococcus aquaticus TaxID=328692 RepID=A0ABY7V645_9DEIO|nr:hypothetical protein [Deinococcus aquaticus]WDA60678.1 hypothetical protein M8445_17065 [Deinococcus aquaticus]
MAVTIRDNDPWVHAHPDEWRAARLGRPGRPPKPEARVPPPPPLGVRVTDSLRSPLRDETLPRGAAPWLRPERVEVWSGTEWLESAPALTALNKRSLYLPAAWPDEIDDRTGVTGRLRVTYPAGPASLSAATQRVLTARATVGGAWLVDGQPVTAYPLGPHAPGGKRPPRGVHPWAIVTTLVSAPSEGITFELDTRGSRISQLLLALSGAP